MPTFDIPKNQFHSAQIPAMHRLLSLANAKTVVEVGSWLGESTSIIADYIKPGKVYSVDWFKGNPGTVLDDIAKNTDVFSIFKKNLEELDLYKYVTPFIMSSEEASKFIPDNFADLIFIDACHDYENIKKDISIWLPKVKKQGIICGHDCESMEWEEEYINLDVFNGKHHGVIKAVNESFKEFNIDERIWWVKI